MKKYALAALAMMVAAPAMADNPYTITGIVCGYGKDAIEAVQNLNKALYNYSEGSGQENPHTAVDQGPGLGMKWIKKPFETSPPTITNTGVDGSDYRKVMACSAVNKKYIQN
jgi:hypothetical protein